MFKHVLIPVDVSLPKDAARLLAKAKTLTDGWGAKVSIVTVIPDAGMPIVGSYFDKGFEAESRKTAEAELQKLVAATGVEADQQVLTGRIYDCIIAEAGRLKADLILVGAHQPEFRDYLLGANAARIVRHAKTSVLVIREEG